MFRQRPLEGLLGGLWELPGVYLQDREGLDQGRVRLEQELAGVVNLNGAERDCLPPLSHGYAHFRESLVVFMYTKVTIMTGKSLLRKEPRYRWFYSTQFSSFPITGATRKILETHGHVGMPAKNEQAGEKKDA